MSASEPPRPPSAHADELALPLSQRVRARLGWDRLVFPHELHTELREIPRRWGNRMIVNRDWGLGDGAGSEGVVCLFAGEPGTGKTAAAAAICQELGLPLYRANVAGIVSKYIGETEKNLAAILDGAEEHGVALVFDEADAIFAKRTDARGSGELSHNTQVAYLLDRIEHFNGLAFLTTNIDSVIDSAFRRRFHLWIRFEKPGPAERRQIFEMTLAKAPLASDIDFEQLAEVDLNGGSIQKVSQNAAFAAAQAGSSITMEMMNDAIRREMISMNRLVRDF